MVGAYLYFQSIERFFMKKIFLIFLMFIVGLLLQAEIEIYFAPNGGFAKNNNIRTITMKNGAVVPATLNNSLLQLLENTENGGTIKIAMYSFSYRPVQEALIDAAKNRQIKVKLIMDGVMDWSQKIREEFRVAILDEHAAAKKEGRIFDFQLKETSKDAMKIRGRYKFEREKKLDLYGSMHEKFGLCFPKGCKIPLTGFCGSANVSASASDVYAENRVIFYNEPAMGRQLAEEFARLWNEYGTAVTDNCESESFIPATTNLTEVQIISNSKPLDEENIQRIDRHIMNMMELADRNDGSIEIAIFSFTHQALAEKILNIAESNPNMKVRILMDQSQLFNTETNPGALGMYLMRNVELKDLKNVEIRFKWRSNAYAWDTETNSPQLIHFRNPLLHHKCMIVNRNRMALGSYNWSSSAEFRNFENVMFFHGDVPEHSQVIGRFVDEFDIMWNNLKPQGPATQKISPPQVVTGTQGIQLRESILQALTDDACRKIMDVLDTRNAGCTEEDLQRLTGLDISIVKSAIVKLQNVTLVSPRIKDQKTLYQLAD